MAHRLTDEPADAAEFSLRPTRPEDQGFLLDLYASTRAEELALVPWTDDAKAAFVEQQFTAQDLAYRGHYPNGAFLLIEERGEPIGRISTARLPDEIRVVDVILVPEARGRGIGTALMRAVLAEASGEGLAVRLHVELWNPAKRLYDRLGFRRLETRGIYEFMEWRAEIPQLKTAS